MEPGIECEFLYDIARIMNASIHVVYSGDGLIGKRESNGSWSEKDRFLQLKQIDILIGGIYTSRERIDDFETSHWYMKNSLAWHVPAARPISKSKILWVLLAVSQNFYFRILFETNQVDRLKSSHINICRKII